MDMSLKVIEMQIALPRTQDAGKIQEQLQQRSQIQHDHAAHEVQKEVEKKEHSVVKEERKSSVQLHTREGNPDKGSFIKGKKRKKNNNTEEKTASTSLPHPYKGKSIDYSG
jgi:hypothetical protein